MIYHAAPKRGFLLTAFPANIRNQNTGIDLVNELDIWLKIIFSNLPIRGLLRFFTNHPYNLVLR